MKHQYYFAFRLVAFTRRWQVVTLAIQTPRLGKEQVVERLDGFEVHGAVYVPPGVFVIEAAVDDVVSGDLRTVFALQQIAELILSAAPLICIDEG